MDDKIKILEHYNLWGRNTLQLGFIRHEYTDKISAYMGNGLVKVLVGQRRVGKSYLLRQLATSLVEKGVDKKNIFMLNRELTDFDFLNTYVDLDDLFKSYLNALKPQGKIYLFIDEIQNIEGWEHFVNSYSQNYVNEYEVFISGSNSKMLSGELATLLSGRYVRFEILPFSYNEFIGITDKNRSKQSYMEYIQDGGMPELFHLKQPEIKRNYISTLKDTVLLRDIIQRYSIKDARFLEDLFVYVVNNASNMLSIRNIVNYFKTKGRKVSYDTVSAYLKYIEESYIIHRTERFNIRGKETIAGNCKYYVNDLSFYNYLYRGFGYGIGYQLENLIYLDMRRAGYDIYVGSIKGKEVDFVAIKGDRTIYVQSSYLLFDENTVTREYTPLEAIDDNYEKYIVSLDDIALPSKKGIKHVLAWDFFSLVK